MCNAIVKKFWRLFISLKLALTLIVSLLLGTLAGMFYDQTLSYQEHIAQFAPDSLFLPIFNFFELGDVFHSWWFSIIMLTLALNLIACSIERLPPIWIEIKNRKKNLTLSSMLQYRFNAHAVVPNFTCAQKTLAPFFTQKMIVHKNSDEINFFKEKHTFARMGVYLIHIALLIIMFSAIIGSNLSIDGTMFIATGQKSNLVKAKGPGGLTYLHDLGFSIECNDFRLSSFADGSPMDYESDLTVLRWQPQGYQPLKNKTIQVNDPLDFNGYYFYQSSYQPIGGQQKIILAIGKHGLQQKKYEVAIGESIQISDKLAYKAIEVYDDYAGLGAAVKVKKTYLKNQDNTDFIIFRKYPDFDSYVRRGQYDVVFLGTKQSYATGLSVAKTPYLQFIFAGFALMLVGMMMAFFMRNRRFYGTAKKQNDNTWLVAISAYPNRHQQAFKNEFEQLKLKFKQKVKEVS